MSFDFDTGSSGSEGPWLQWTARGTLDGAIGARQFVLRDENGKSPFDGFAKGVVLDVANMRTGWCYSSGVAGQAPDWRWNASLGSFAPKPGDEYKKGFSIRCAIGGGKAATWEQSGAAAWNAFVALVPAIQAGQVDSGKLPLVRQTDVKVEKFARGTTVTPILEIVKWVERPDCLKPGFDAGPDDAPAPQPAKAATPPAAAPAYADGDEF